FHGWRYKRSNGFARVCQRQACDHFDAKGMCTSYVPKWSRGGALSRLGKRKNENLLTLGTVLVHLLQVARQRAKPPARAFFTGQNTPLDGCSLGTATRKVRKANE